MMINKKSFIQMKLFFSFVIPAGLHIPVPATGQSSKKDGQSANKLAIVHLFLRDSGGIQTHNLLIRSQMLYSVELRNHFRFAGAKVLTFFGTTKLLEDFFRKKCSFTR